jgi:hypothetical protein
VGGAAVLEGRGGRECSATAGVNRQAASGIRAVRSGEALGRFVAAEIARYVESSSSARSSQPAVVGRRAAGVLILSNALLTLLEQIRVRPRAGEADRTVLAQQVDEQEISADVAPGSPSSRR